MKFMFSVLIALAVTGQVAFAGNYVLTIDDKEYDVSLDEKEQIKVGDQYHSVTLTQKENITYKTDNFSFQHSNRYSPSRNDLGDGIYQTAMMSSLGTLVMVQEYLTIDPSSIVDLMANEVTKEERDYGYDIKSKPITLTLSDGVKLVGKEVTSKYKGSDIKRYIITYGAKDSGLLIMTQIDYDVDPAEEVIITNFFDSLAISMK